MPRYSPPLRDLANDEKVKTNILAHWRGRVESPPALQSLGNGIVIKLGISPRAAPYVSRVVDSCVRGPGTTSPLILRTVLGYPLPCIIGGGRIWVEEAT